MRALIVGLVTLAILSGAAEIAGASCAPLSLSERFSSADVVVEGTVARMREPGLYEVIVQRALKGNASGTIAVRGADAGGVVSTVDLALTTGSTYTMYLRRDLDAFTTNACSGSREGAATADELAFSGTQATGGTGSATVGRSAANGTGDTALAPTVGLGLAAAAILFAFALAALRAPRWSRG